MRMIAHRANIHGANPETENTLGAIQKCFDAGYDVEIDVLNATGNKFYIGHDEVSDVLNIRDFDQGVHRRFWFHAKRIDVLEHLLTLKEIHNYKFDVFYHDQDVCVVTANRYIWTYPNVNISKTAGRMNIIVMPELVGLKPEMIRPYPTYGICTDKPIVYEGLMQK